MRQRVLLAKTMEESVVIESDGTLSEGELMNLGDSCLRAQLDGYFGDVPSLKAVIENLREEGEEDFAERVERHVTNIIAEFDQMPDQSMPEAYKVETLKE